MFFLIICFLNSQVSRIEVQYDKTSKQVDVQALKVTLWDHMQQSPQMSNEVGDFLCYVEGNDIMIV